jgi:hypothetical protein
MVSQIFAHKLKTYPKLSQIISTHGLLFLQRIYDQKQLITVGKNNLSDISTVPYIRDHEKNGLQAYLKDINDWTGLPLSQRLFFTLSAVIFEVQIS